MSDQPHPAASAPLTIAQALSEAASAPIVKVSAGGTMLAGLGDWLTTGAGIATAIGLCMTAASLLLQVWKVRRDQELAARRDAREQAEHEARMQALRGE